MTPDERYAKVVEIYQRRRGVTRSGRGFGASALKINGKMFATLSARGEFVVKLPEGRVEQLVKSGDAEPFNPSRGRQMREWIALKPTSRKRWSTLAEEALRFVAANKQK